MTGFDYRQSRIARLIGMRPAFAPTRALRHAVAAIAGALLLAGAAGIVEHARVAALDRDIATLAARGAAAERDDARVARLESTVAATHALLATIGDARRSTALAANTIVRIGNRLPPQTWLTRVTTDRTGAWSIGGRSTRLDEIGTMLGTIARLEGDATPRLVSVTAAGRRATLLDFTVAIEPHR